MTSPARLGGVEAGETRAELCGIFLAQRSPSPCHHLDESALRGGKRREGDLELTRHPSCPASERRAGTQANSSRRKQVLDLSHPSLRCKQRGHNSLSSNTLHPHHTRTTSIGWASPPRRKRASSCSQLVSTSRKDRAISRASRRMSSTLRVERGSGRTSSWCRPRRMSRVSRGAAGAEI